MIDQLVFSSLFIFEDQTGFAFCRNKNRSFSCFFGILLATAITEIKLFGFKYVL
jgi:hypothetical protein